MFTLPIANRLQELDGIMTAFNLTRIFDDAALAFLSLAQASTTATNFNMQFETVAG